ncbi:MAG: MBL fold metallo-hydrolase [Myxococcales bacterium]
MSDNVDLSKPVVIAPDTYWVGQCEGSLLERNIFLRVFKKNGQALVNLLVDPGPPADLIVLANKVGAVAGELRNVNLVFANHQDPDVAFNAGYLQKLNPNLTVVCSEDTWRLIRFYGLNPKRYYAVERFKNLSMQLATGHELRFVPTPFCHFRGATMIYDPETRVLFTGDLLGGLTYLPSFFATEQSWEGMKAFHQIYMPTQEALALAVRSIRALDPAPVLIAPQHGSLITADWIPYFLERLERLPVGLNLLLDSHQKENYLAAMNELLMELARTLGSTPIGEAIRILGSDDSISSVIQADATGVRDIKVDLRTAIEIFTQQLARLLPGQGPAIGDGGGQGAARAEHPAAGEHAAGVDGEPGLRAAAGVSFRQSPRSQSSNGLRSPRAGSPSFPASHRRSVRS